MARSSSARYVVAHRRTFHEPPPAATITTVLDRGKMMSMTAAVSVLVYDETPGEGRSTPYRLQLASERITVRQLIERRVRAEVDAHNRAPAGVFPTANERALNGERPREPRPLDPEAQCTVALSAFRAGRFFVLVDDHQVEDLDEEIVIGSDTEVGFFKLLPLVGG
jgi:hypothetical protein